MKFIRVLIISLFLVFNLAVSPAMASKLNTYNDAISNIAQRESSDIPEIKQDLGTIDLQKRLLAELFSDNQKIKATIFGEDYLIRRCPKPPRPCN
jgi:hypothetical protein